MLDNLEIVLAKLSKQQMDTFLLSLFSDTERLMFGKRLAMAIMIKEGLKDAQISQTLRVTRVTITRMRAFLKSRGQGYNLALQKLSEEKPYKEFRKFLLRSTPSK